MKLFLPLFTVALAFAPFRAFADEPKPGISRFDVGLMMLEFTYTPKIDWDKAFALRKSHPKAMDNIARFWETKARMEHWAYIHNLMAMTAKTLSNPNDEAEKEALEQGIQEQIDRVYLCFFYDHAEEIMAMIEHAQNRHDANEQKKKEMSPEDRGFLELDEPLPTK